MYLDLIWCSNYHHHVNNYSSQVTITMGIKEVILSLSELLSHFGLPLHPETLRLSKFNDPKALKSMHTFLINVTNFISKNTRSNPPKTETSDDLIEIAKLIGFPHWMSLATSSYACLMLLVWYIENIKLLPLLEQLIYSRLRTSLNGQMNVSSCVNSVNENDDIYERMQQNHFQKLKLQRLIREFCMTVMKDNISKEKGFVGLKIPSSEITGSTALDVFVTNNDNITNQLSEMDEIIIMSECLSKFKSDYHVFIKWVTSVDYGLEKDSPSLETELLTSIIDLQAQIEMSTENKGFSLSDCLFVRSANNKHNNINLTNQALEAALFEIEEKIAKQKAIILDLVEGSNVDIG